MSATTGLAQVLGDWRPGTVEITRRVEPWPLRAFAGLIGGPPPGDVLPPLWHAFVLLDDPPTRENTGEDGHPAHGPFLPPIPGRRRMFAGARLRLDAPIPVGAALTGRSAVSATEVKSGRTGEMAFVTVRTELSVEGTAVGVEEQDVVYRSEPPGTPRRTMQRAPATGDDPAGDWRLELPTDPALLYRTSALLANGHRIHYDHPYATGVEGYPGLVVHGPLLALLALELPRRHAPGRAVRGFSYRLARPAFVPDPIVARARCTAAGAEVTVGVRGAEPSLTATVELE